MFRQEAFRGLSSAELEELANHIQNYVPSPNASQYAQNMMSSDMSNALGALQELQRRRDGQP